MTSARKRYTLQPVSNNGRARVAKTQLGTVELETSSGTLLFDVRIIEVKRSYGKLRYMVTPIAGSGQARIEKVTNIRPDPSATLCLKFDAGGNSQRFRILRSGEVVTLRRNGEALELLPVAGGEPITVFPSSDVARSFLVESTEELDE